MTAGRSAAKNTAAEGPAKQQHDSAAGASARQSADTPSTQGRPAARTATRPSARGAKKSATKAAAKAAKTAEKKAGKTAAKKAASTEKAVRSSTKKTAKRATAKRAEAQQTGARTVAAKKTTTQEPSAVPQARGTAVAPGELAVRSGEEPWTAEEVEEARAELQEEALLRRTEITDSEDALTGLMRDSGDGAGDDQADTGSKNITREHQLALAGNAREMLYQIERALERMDAGTYGLCESCGNAIGKARMQAFPRATLCVECKQRQERR